MKVLRLCFVVSLILLILQNTAAQSSSQTEATNTYGGKSSYFDTASFSPNSSHILIGNAFQRKITQIGLGYEHQLTKNRFIGTSFEGSIVPVFLESDPTGDGAYIVYPDAPTQYTYFTPVRTLGILGTAVPVGEVYYGNGFIPVYGIRGPNQTTYAFAALPIGVRISGLPRSRIQPTFAINLGALYATRNIPIDDTSSFNFLAYAGPGIEVFLSRKRSLRFEYLYDHLSNANLGDSNPGVDSATFRLTLSRYR